MLKTLKKNLIFILIGLFVLCAIGFLLSPKSASAKTLKESVCEETDYSFVGYSIYYSDKTSFDADNSGESSLRFKMRISSEMYSKIETEKAKTGVLVEPKYYLEKRGDSELGLYTTVYDGQPEIVKVETTSVWEEENGNYECYVFIKDIPKKYYGVDFIARGYIETKDNVYYTAETTARSFTYTANEEIKDVDSPYSEEEKQAIKDSLLTFKVNVNGKLDEKNYKYGDTVSLTIGEITDEGLLIGYEDYLTKEFIVADSVALDGFCNLYSKYISIEEYFTTKAKNNFKINNLPSDITSAKLVKIGDLSVGLTSAFDGGESVSVNTEYERVSLSNTLNLEVGSTYLMQITDSVNNVYYQAFTVDDAYTDVPYSSGDKFVLPFDINDGSQSNNHTVTSIKKEDGTNVTLNNESVLVGIEANANSKPRQERLTITDSNGDVYKVYLDVYTDVIYNDEEATKFFIGDATFNGEVWTIDYKTATIQGRLSGCYALASDVDIKAPLNYLRSGSTFIGLFDGLGHTLKYVSNNTVVSGSALFGANFNGVIQNMGIEIYFDADKCDKTTEIIACHHIDQGDSVGTLENVYIKASAKVLPVSAQLDYTLFVRRTVNDKIKLKDVLFINNLGKVGNGPNHSNIWRYDMGYQFKPSTNEEKKAVEDYNEKTKQFKSGVVNAEGVYILSNSDAKATYIANKQSHDMFYATVFAENTKPKSDLRAGEFWYKGMFMYGISDAKSMAIKHVGDWKVVYGEKDIDTVATFID